VYAAIVEVAPPGFLGGAGRFPGSAGAVLRCVGIYCLREEGSTQVVDVGQLLLD
jgi:hypothetical protein